MISYRLPINLLIADDHQLIIDGLSKILADEKLIGELYSANNGKEAVDKILAENIDCVIMDINMPVLNGLEATKIIKQAKPYIKIIVVSMLCDASIVSKMIKVGADAFINKDTGKSELLKAIDKVMRGEKYISPEISKPYFSRQRAMKASASTGAAPAFCGSPPVLSCTNSSGRFFCELISLANASQMLGRSTE